MLQDVHAHLQNVPDKGGIEAVLSGLARNNIGRIFCNATSPDDWDEVSAIAGKHKEVTPFYGVHPWFAAGLKAGWDKELLRRLESGPCGIGEIGLDRAKEDVDIGTQKEIFGRQLEIAFGMGKPFTAHCVDAWGIFVDMLKKAGAGELPFIVHSFSGSVETLTELLKLGAYASFSLKLVEKRYKKISEAFAATPLDRMLLETDFPYTPGSQPKGQALSGDYFGCAARVYEIVSKLKGVPKEKLEKAVWENGTVFVH